MQLVIAGVGLHADIEAGRVQKTMVFTCHAQGNNGICKPMANENPQVAEGLGA